MRLIFILNLIEKKTDCIFIHMSLIWLMNKFIDKTVLIIFLFHQEIRNYKVMSTVHCRLILRCLILRNYNQKKYKIISNFVRLSINHIHSVKNKQIIRLQIQVVYICEIEQIWIMAELFKNIVDIEVLHIKLRRKYVLLLKLKEEIESFINL